MLTSNAVPTVSPADQLQGQIDAALREAIERRNVVEGELSFLSGEVIRLSQALKSISGQDQSAGSTWPIR